jgi:hypothetical protein
MTAIVNRLTKHVAKMKAGEITESTVHRFMSLLRELLEERKERNKYQLLTMFCDWALHTGLDRSKAGGMLLDILDSTWANSQNVDAQIGEIMRGISPRTLRDQMFALLGGSFVDPSVVVEADYCVRIMDHLITDLQGKPVARSIKDSKKIESDRLAKGYRFMADRFYFEHDEKYGNQFVLAAKQIEPSSGGNVFVKIPWPIPHRQG